MRLWTIFFNKLKHNYYVTEKPYYAIAADSINTRLSIYDGYIIPSENPLFNVDDWITKMVDTMTDNYESLDTIEGAFELAGEVGRVITNMWKDYLQKRDNPTPIQKIRKSILDQVNYQENPENRIVSAVRFEDIPKFEDSSEYIPVYKVFITSDCDGWAEDENKFVGYSLSNDPNIFIGKSEADIDEDLNSFNAFVKFLSHIDDFTETVENTDEESEDYGMVFINSSPYCDICEALANAYLITDKGGCNWENIHKLQKFGFKVYPGDYDSFGWLTGCIENPNGHVLVYG